MPNPNTRYSNQLAATFADLGLEHACISPGSRNTPLIAAFGAEDRIRTWPVIDERSAAFFALGIARSTQRPVALVCTSGTAAAEYHPAIIEASQSEVPLLVLTADRPTELRAVGAPQTIDQVELYGSSTRLFVDATPPDDTTTADEATELAIAAWRAASGDNPGPAHLNLPFREPLLTGGLPPAATKTVIPKQGALESPDLSDLADRISGRNGIIVAGRCNDRDFPAACAALAATTGYPIVADPISGLRFGTHSLEHVLTAGDALAAAGALDKLVPDLVIRFGPVPTSKATWSWLERHPNVEQLLIDVAGRDATHSASSVLATPPSVAAMALADGVTRQAPEAWTASWQKLDSSVAAFIDSAVTDVPFPNEPAIARTVILRTPPGGSITVGSSMPIRDIDTYGGTAARAIQVFGNRGANGIDGIVSSALGAAAAGPPATVLVGDVSMFHDLNAIGTAAQLDLPITIIVVHNDGGGIFHFLPQRDPQVLRPELFESHLATPHGTDFVTVAQSLGVAAHDVHSVDELASLVGDVPIGPRLVQVRTDRSTNFELHRAVGKRVTEVVARWQPTESTSAET